MKIVINGCYGGFSVSKAVYEELGIPWDGFGYLNNSNFNIESSDYSEYRTHPDLIAAIEKIGTKEASGDMADLRIVDVPDDIDWFIDDYDGVETVHEAHRSW